VGARARHHHLAPASAGLPTVAVYGLTLAGGKKASDRVLYAATHGRGVWRIQLPKVKKH
jgi:hypothetical protein